MEERRSTLYSVDDIDWIALRKRVYAQKSRRRKTASEWDRSAPGFAKRVENSAYIRCILERLPLTAGMSLLDIGCGPGTLALPIAKKVGSTGMVTALDFSKRMLDMVEESAREQGITNISTAHLAWEDDWHGAGLVPHDITLASRSTGVSDFPGALKKLQDFARIAVFLTDRINPTPFESEAFAAVGIPLRPGPDYIYTLNILYQMGIHANMEVVEFDRIRHYSTMSEAMEGFLWMFEEISDKQKDRLCDYIRSISRIESDGSLTVYRKNPPRWALLWWEK